MKKCMAVLFLALAAQSSFCQSGGFPMGDYQKAVELRDFTKITQIIKKYGTNSPYYGDSVLYKAAEANDVELVKVLLEAGIPKEMDSGVGAGVSLIYLALKSGNLDMVKLLMKHYPLDSGDVSAAIERGNIEALNLFMANGVDLSKGGSQGSYFGGEFYSYLNRAVLYGRLELAKRFLKEGLSLNTLDISESMTSPPDSFQTIRSAMDIAKAAGNQEMKSWLLSNGAKSGYEILNGMSLPEIEERFRPKKRYGTGPDPLSYQTTTDDLRYRAEPTLAGAVLGLLNSREKLYVVCRSTEKMDIDGINEYWLYVISDTGKRGWAYGGYLKLKK
ncbi:MAG: hypothetical protein E4H36_11595 [Spirochaetales bacterium]|nr:MAG: hypothetical protein E4H36_11595 [Spirochaetales bacterium]